jgi:hypothetical protein
MRGRVLWCGKEYGEPGKHAEGPEVECHDYSPDQKRSRQQRASKESAWTPITGDRSGGKGVDTSDNESQVLTGPPEEVMSAPYWGASFVDKAYIRSAFASSRYTALSSCPSTAQFWDQSEKSVGYIYNIMNRHNFIQLVTSFVRRIRL